MIASIVLITSVSGSSVPVDRMTIARDVSRLAISRSSISVGLPDRQTTVVLPGAAEATADLVVHLALVAVGQDDDRALRPWFSFAMTSSETIVKISCDQPRMTVWPGLDDPRATLAQLRELALQAGVDDADQGADDEDPEERDGQHPEQEAERCRSRRPSSPGRASASGCSTAGPTSGSAVDVAAVGIARGTRATRVIAMMPIAATTNSPAIRAIVPRAMKLSKS